MKKLKCFLLLIVGIIMVSSCSSTEEIDQIEPQTYQAYDTDRQELVEFQVKLDSLNQQMFPNQNIETRGFKDFFKKFVAVVISDAVGGMFGASAGPAGAAAGAILSSAIAAFVPAESISFLSTDDPYDTDVNVNLPEIALGTNLVPSTPSPTGSDAIEDSIGYYHNFVLHALNNNLPEGPVDLDTLIEKVADLTYVSYHTTQKAVIDNLKANQPQFEKITGIMPNVGLYDDLHTMMRGFIRQFPGQAQELSVLETFLEGLINIEVTDNNGEYLNAALELLNNSSMNAKIKQSLRNALIVGNASYQLWDIH